MQKKSTPNLSTSQRAIGFIASAVALIVALGTVLIVSPVGTPLRSEVRSVALPYFGQNWKVFAPNILKADRTLEFRVGWFDENDKIVRSEWINLTEIEQMSAQGNPFPSRIQKMTWNSSANYRTRYFALDEDQRAIARDTFIQVGSDGFESIPDAELIEKLGTDDSAVIRYLRMDYMFMRDITLYATAGFDKKIERVQWRIRTHRPNDFAHRFQEEQQFAPNVVTFGWRQSNVRTDADIVSEYRALIERVGAEGAFREEDQ